MLIRLRSANTLIGMTLLLSVNSVWANPSFADVKAAWRTSDVVILDRNGKEMQRIRVDLQVRRLDWVTLSEISPAMRHALLISEDKRFYAHSGVDWSGVAAAAWGNLWNTKTRGASTITMQLAGLLDADLAARASGRSVWQKVGQGWSASWLEAHWTKAEILEAYLNKVSFRGELVGLSALSQTLFGKMPSGLNYQESAIATALLRGPNASINTVTARACKILQDLRQTTHCELLNVDVAQALARSKSANSLAANAAPHFARKVIDQHKISAGSIVHSTLSLSIQQLANSLLRRHLSALAQRNVQDGALVVLDNESGDILAWVGSAANSSSAADVDGVTALRQAGSTLKPFLYQLAIERHYLSAASLLDDSPLDLQTAAGLYAPQNYAKDFKGLVSVRTALASSLNVPAVRTITMVGPNLLRDRLTNLGIQSLQQDGNYYGYSLALGAADVRLLEITNAYRTLANQGIYSPLRWQMQEPKAIRSRRLDASSTFIINDILADRTARARTFGLESTLSTPYWSAVKTGTSKDMRDNWAVGFTHKYTVGVWVGNANGEPMWNVSGMHGAAPIWQSMLDFLQSGGSSRSISPPAGLRRRLVRYENNIEPSRDEWFLTGTERENIIINKAEQDQAAGIISPLDNSIFAVDPDIPPKHQRILFRARGINQPQWYLDKRLLGRGNLLSWFPWPGRHSLQLRDQQGQLIEEVKFEVRGAIVKQR